MKAVPERITVPTWASLIWGPYQFERPYWRHKYTHWYKELVQIPPLAAQEMFDDPKKNWCLTKCSMSLRWRPTIANLCKSLDTVNLTRPGDQQKQPFFSGIRSIIMTSNCGDPPKTCSLFNQIATPHFLTENTQNTGTCCFPICNSRFSCANLMQSARDSFGVSNEGMDDPFLGWEIWFQIRSGEFKKIPQGHMIMWSS